MQELHPSDADALIRASWPARRVIPLPQGCTGPCQQGRERCPTPDACHQADEYHGENVFRGLGVAIAITAAGIVSALLLAHVVGRWL